MTTSRRWLAILVLIATLGPAGPALGQDPPAHDLLNRTAEEEAAIRKNLEKLGFPLGAPLDTVLMAREQPDWGSAKGTRRFESAPFGHDFKLSNGDQRKAKRGVLDAWPGP